MAVNAGLELVHDNRSIHAPFFPPGTTGVLCTAAADTERCESEDCACCILCVRAVLLLLLLCGGLARHFNAQRSPHKESYRSRTTSPLQHNHPQSTSLHLSLPFSSSVSQHSFPPIYPSSLHILLTSLLLPLRLPFPFAACLCTSCQVTLFVPAVLSHLPIITPKLGMLVSQHPINILSFYQTVYLADNSIHSSGQSRLTDADRQSSLLSSSLPAPLPSYSARSPLPAPSQTQSVPSRSV